MANVKFFFTNDLNKYNALTTKDPFALYFVEDESTGFKALYKGDSLIAVGSDATTQAAGLMSAADKQSLDNLIATGGTGLTPVEGGGISIVDGKIEIAISSEVGNTLVAKDDGLYVPAVSEVDPATIPDFIIEKQATPETGYFATYKLKKILGDETSYVGDSINISEDKVLSSAELKVVKVAGEPIADSEVGDPYIDLGFNDAEATHLYIPMKSLVDEAIIYTAGDGIKIENNVVSINLGSSANGLQFVDGTFNLALATKDTAGAFSAVDKGNLDKLIALDIPTTYGAAYEISSKPTGALVNYNGKEIRVMCPADTQWTLQQVGANGDASKYYIGFKAYAPSSNIVSFKESLDTTMTDQTMYYFEGNDFAGIDANGRKYSIVWLPVAKHNDDDTWTYYGANSTSGKLIGWNYCVEWYDASGICVASDLIRINLSNESTHYAIEPYYMNNYATKSELEDVSNSMSWGEL